MTTGEIVRALPEIALDGDPSVRVGRAVLDSRRVAPGDIFAALPGRATDGRRFVADALRAGASAILAAPPRPSELPADMPFLAARRPRRALGHLARLLAGAPDERLALVAVTGTDGKTTTVEMIAAALRRAGVSAVAGGTLGHAVAAQRVHGALTTPEAPDLWEFLEAAADDGCEAAAIEVSSVALVEERVVGARFRIAALTSLGTDHLDYHGTREAYHGAKRALFANLPSSATAVLPADVPEAAPFFEAGPARVVTFGCSTDAGWRVVDHAPTPDGARFRLVGPGIDAEVATPRPGLWDARNIACAVAVAAALGASPSEALEGASSVARIAGRWERIDEGQPFLAVVDYAHTPDALRRTLELMREVVTGRVIVAFGCGGGRDADKRSSMGRAAGELADVVIVTDDNPRDEDPEAIASAVVAGVESAGTRAERMADRAGAIRRAVTAAGAGDGVLIAGKGHETHQERRGAREPFDDREVLRTALRARKEPS